MALPKVGATLVLDNDQLFKQAISEINAGLRVNKTAMQAAAAESAGMDNKQKALRLQMDALSKTIECQKDKIKALEEATANAARRDGEGAASTMKWQASLNSARAELGRMNAKMGEYQAQQKEATSLGGRLSEMVNGLASKLGITLPAGAQNAINGLAGLASPTTIAIAAFSALAKVAQETYEKLEQLASKGAAWSDDLLTLSDQTGISAQRLQEFAYAENLVDVSSNVLSSSMAKLKVKIGDNDESLRNLARASGMVISTNGEAYDTFLQIIDALGAVTNENKRAALASDIFGRSYQDLAPLINKGSEALKAYGREAHETGIILTDEQTAALGELQDSYDKLAAKQKAVQNLMAAELAPGFKAANEAQMAFADVMQDLGEAYLPVANSMLESGVDLLIAAEPLINTLVVGLEGVALTLQSIITAIQAIKGLVTGDWAAYNTSNARVNQIWGAIEKTMGRMSGSGIAQYAVGTSYASPGLALVGEDGPELVTMRGGERVYDAGRTRGMLGGGDTYYNITIDAKNIREMNDIIRIANSEATRIRQGVTK